MYPEERRVFGRDWTFEPGTFDSEGIPDGPDLYRLHLDENEEGIEIVTMGGDHHWWFENMPESGDIEAALVDWLSALLSLIPPAQVVGAMGEEVKLRILDALRQWRRQNLVQDQCGACFQPLDAERKYVAQVIFTEQRMAERDQAIRERDEARVEVGHLRVAVAAVLREVVTTTGEDHG